MEIIEQLAEAMAVQAVRGGEQIFQEGSAADSMLVLLKGRLRILRRDADGQPLLYNEISPGEIVGDMGLILEQQRTSDVVAVRDSTYAILTREVLQVLLKRFPVELNQLFCQAIYNRIRPQDKNIERHQAHAFVVIPLHREACVREVAESLTQALSRKSQASLMRPLGEQQPRPEGGNDYLVFEGDLAEPAWTRRAFLQSDQIIFVANADAECKDSVIENLLASEPGFTLMRRHLLLFHKPGQSASTGAIERWRRERDVERVYLARQGINKDFERLARFLTNSAVGLVLGGGGARGFAHLGAIQAMEDASIPIDIIGGNSMGALIGAQYAMGIPTNEILEGTRRFALGGEHPALPVLSLLSGRRMSRDLQKMFGGEKIETLWQPFFAATCNLSKACITVRDTGPVWQAVMASNSPAGLLPPVLQQGELLVDCAILDNVPVTAMRSRLGAPLEKRRGNGTVIAIDVDVRETLAVSPEVKGLSTWGSLKSLWGIGNEKMPNIIDVLSRATHIGGLAQRSRAIALSDFYLEPPVSEFSMMGYRKAEQIARIGYNYASEQISRWKLPG